jgi:hypothetical protein
MNIEQIFKEAKERINTHIEMLYIQALSKIQSKESSKEVTEKMIENYLKKRGYIQNTLSGEKVFTKDFVVVKILDNEVELWHDIPASASLFVNNSLLTGLPISLNYMERI